MKEYPSSRGVSPLWLIATMLLMVTYLVGYFVLSDFLPAESASRSLPFPAIRYLDHDWMETAYEPLRMLESSVRQERVVLVAPHVLQTLMQRSDGVVTDDF